MKSWQEVNRSKKITLQQSPGEELPRWRRETEEAQPAGGSDSPQLPAAAGGWSVSTQAGLLPRKAFLGTAKGTSLQCSSPKYHQAPKGPPEKKKDHQSQSQNSTIPMHSRSPERAIISAGDTDPCLPWKANGDRCKMGEKVSTRSYPSEGAAKPRAGE